MTPPAAPAPGQTGQDADERAAVLSFCPALVTLRKRSDFLKAAQARRQGTPGFLLQGRERAAGEAEGMAVRVGYTCSRKVGNAVTRNRAKRRLRAIARDVLPRLARPGWDYVLVGRPEATTSRDFAQMRADLEQALDRIHGGRT